MFWKKKRVEWTKETLTPVVLRGLLIQATTGILKGVGDNPVRLLDVNDKDYPSHYDTHAKLVMFIEPIEDVSDGEEVRREIMFNIDMELHNASVRSNLPHLTYAFQVEDKVNELGIRYLKVIFWFYFLDYDKDNDDA